MKKIRLNENTLRNIIKESVSKILRENYGSFDSVTPNKYKLFELLDEGMIDPKETAEELIRWMSEDDCGSFIAQLGLNDDEDEYVDDDDIEL